MTGFFLMDTGSSPGMTGPFGRGSSLLLAWPSKSARLIPHYCPTTSMRWSKLAIRTCVVGNSMGESGMYIMAVFRAIAPPITHHHYRTYLHSIRGPPQNAFAHPCGQLT